MPQVRLRANTHTTSFSYPFFAPLRETFFTTKTQRRGAYTFYFWIFFDVFNINQETIPSNFSTPEAILMTNSYLLSWVAEMSRLLIRRKIRRSVYPVRLFPSTNGWFTYMLSISEAAFSIMEGYKSLLSNVWKGRSIADFNDSISRIPCAPPNVLIRISCICSTSFRDIIWPVSLIVLCLLLVFFPGLRCH